MGSLGDTNAGSVGIVGWQLDAQSGSLLGLIFQSLYKSASVECTHWHSESGALVDGCSGSAHTVSLGKARSRFATAP